MACRRSPVRSRLAPPWFRLQRTFGPPRPNRPGTTSPSSRGLGHHPFTVDTGVRIPVGTPLQNARASGRSSFPAHGDENRAGVRLQPRSAPMARRARRRCVIPVGTPLQDARASGCSSFRAHGTGIPPRFILDAREQGVACPIGPFGARTTAAQPRPAPMLEHVQSSRVIYFACFVAR